MSDSHGEWANSESLAEHIMTLLEKYDVKWRRYGLIYVDHQPGNITVVNILLAELSKRLGVPSPLIRARLIELKWLNDTRYTSGSDGAERVAVSLCSLETKSFGVDDEDELDYKKYEN